ncbi:hypothetical protein ACFE04_014420 [Oxalis oulophora]
MPSLANYYLCLFSFVTICHFYLAQAQNTPQDYLNVHNTARSQVGVGGMQWSTSLANYAQNYISKLKGSCKMVHSGGPYGENLAWGSYDMSGKEAVNLWVAEKPKYNYNLNKCIGGECGHYTQVVWRNSIRLGCAKVACNNGGTIISCNYDPPGNYVNERPY